MSGILESIDLVVQENNRLRSRVKALENEIEDLKEKLIRREREPYEVVLEPAKDPDPYGYHKIPLTQRLLAMGWDES